MKSLSEGAAKLADGADALDSGAASLKEGIHKAYTGADTLHHGADVLNTGAGKLHEGIGTLDDGMLKLMNGMEQFKSEGINRLSEVLGDEVDEVIERLNSLAGGESVYTNFGGASADEKTSTKFIFKMEF